MFALSQSIMTSWISLSASLSATLVSILYRLLTIFVCKVKMISVLMLLFFCSQMIHTFANVTVYRGPLISYKTKMMCVSEDDSSALVWNSNILYYSKLNDLKDKQPFLSTCNSDSSINCKMQPSEECWKSWNINFWSFAQSIATPMGLVFDQRWEGFKEYEYSDSHYYSVILNVPEDQTIAIPFSIRAERDLHIVLCKDKNIFKNFCYWVIIGGWGNTKSIIRKCPSGIPEIGKLPEATSTCYKEQTSIIHSPLSIFEWRSFIFTWNAETKNITVYNDKYLLMTYKDTEVYSNVTKSYFTFIRNPEKMLVRYHDYSYFHTINERQALTSPEFKVSSNEVCLQMIIGLCVECNANVALIDSQENIVLQTVTVKGSKVAAEHGLPMWQSIKIHANVSPNKVLKVQLYPKLALSTSNPLWAIADVRQCPPDGCVRQSIAYLYPNYVINKSYFWTNTTCQKLFYTEQTVVYATSTVNPNIETVDADCPEGYIGPNCSISCYEHFESYTNCRRIFICYKNGCTCAPGLLPNHCSTECPVNTYGHNCKNFCGHCKNKKCDKRTGVCFNGCDESKKIYIPPMCQIDIENLEPIIVSKNQTDIIAKFPITWKDEYKETSLQYYYKLQRQNEKIKVQDLKVIFPNMTEGIAHFTNLRPGDAYHISFVLLVNNSEIHSKWQLVNTTCNSPESFDIQANETSITLNTRLDVHPYACPTDFYNVIIRNVDADIISISEFTSSFPFKIQFLQPHTLFNVTMINRNGYRFSQQIRTLAGVPSEVLNLHVTLQSNTQCTLNWSPPENPNGEIKNYTIIAQVNKYLGCPDNKVLTEEENRPIVKSTNETFIIISELHPYTSYGVEIRVYNSRHCSEKTKRTFHTHPNEIPTSKVSKLNIQNGRLSWDYPEDCTTISGRIDKTNITITGISDGVIDYFVTKQTKLQHLDIERLQLPSGEEYMAKVYVLRDYNGEVNDTVYAKRKFKTPPSRPPRVSKLDVVEIDTREKPSKIYLRWKGLQPPINGKLSAYILTVCGKPNATCEIIEIHPNEFCDLWNNYICKIISQDMATIDFLQIQAINVNVTDPSPPSFIMMNTTANFLRTPDPPNNFSATIHNDSVVDLHWYHPWKTRYHLLSFSIWVKEISSNRRNNISSRKKFDIYIHPVTNYTRNYTKRLYLMSSTKYVISIQTVTIMYDYSSTEVVTIQTPSSIGFNGSLVFKAHENDPTIVVKIPRFVNETLNNGMHILVKGPHSCSSSSTLTPTLLAQANVQENNVTWHAANLSVIEHSNTMFTIGDNKDYGGVTNCPLTPGKSYEIIIIVTEGYPFNETVVFVKRSLSLSLSTINTTDKWPYDELLTWVVPIISFFVVLIAAFYFYRK